MEAKGEGVPAKESILVTVLDNIDKACTWVKKKVKSFFSLLTRGFRSLFTSSSEKPEEMLSGNNTQIDNSSETKPMVQVAHEEGEKEEVVVHQDASVPAKGSFFMRVWNKIHEAWTWVKEKVKSASKLFIPESIAEWLKSFVTSWGGKLRELLSWINAKIDEFLERKVGVQTGPEQGSLLGEMKKLLQNIVGVVFPWVESWSSPEMKRRCQKLKWFFKRAGDFTALLEKARNCKQPLIRLCAYFVGTLLAKLVGGVSKQKGT